MPDAAVEQLIPQRGRMKLIEEILSVEGGSATTAATVTDLWPLTEGGCVSPLVAVELVAQTSAAAIGWKTLQEEGETPNTRGLLVGIKTAAFRAETIPVGSRLVTRAAIHFTMDHLTEISGETSLNGDTVGEVTLQVIRLAKEAGDA